MKRQKLMMAVLAAAALGITACGGSAPKETAAPETAAQESAAGTEAGAAEETEEETAEETEPEREFLSVPLTDERCSITYEIFYPAEGVEYEEASVFGDPAHTFSSGDEGCYITVNAARLYTSDINSRLSSYDSVTYGPYNGWTNYTSYAAEGYLITGETDDLTALLGFKIGNLEKKPADQEELKGYLESQLVQDILGSFTTLQEAAPETEAPAETKAPEVIEGGVAHLKYADVVIPEGWSVESVKDFELKLTRDEKVPGRVEGDFLTPKLTISSTSSTKTAQEWAEAKFKDFGSKGEIMNGTFGGTDWVYFTPVEDQFYMFTDSSAGTHVDVSGMFFTLNEEIEGILEGITIK